MVNKTKTAVKLDKTASKTYSTESLNRELVKVAKEILAEKEEKSLASATNPSAIALSTTKHDAGEGINGVKKTVRQLFILYLTNQFVARAINVRADILISRGYGIEGGDDAGIEACGKLIENSGGSNLFWQLSVNTDIAGDGFLEPIKNQSGNKFLRLKHVHPLTLAFKTNLKTNQIIVDSHGNPKSYVQHIVDKNGIQIEKDVAIDKIRHLRFNTLGDEFTGISTIQPGYNTIVRLMNMEYSAAEAAIKTANPLIVGECNTKSPNQIAMWGTILGRINGREQVFVPEGMKLSMLSPGQQNFSDYSSYFLDAVVSTFGVPKALILGESSGGNRGEAVVLSRHLYSLIRGNQRYMEDYFNKIFEEYGKLAGFKAPKLVFKDIAEDAEATAQSAITLLTAGIISVEEARAMIGLYPTGKTLGNELKDSDMKAWHPAEPGSPAGSQKNVKNKQKANEFSEVKSTSK